LEKEESGSFLKKRTKKLSVLRVVAAALLTPTVNRSFFASFFAKKEVLA
jgi:hypothetical protein